MSAKIASVQLAPQAHGAQLRTERWCPTRKRVQASRPTHVRARGHSEDDVSRAQHGASSSGSEARASRRVMMAGVASGALIGTAGACRADIATDTAQALIVKMLRGKQERDTTQAILNNVDVPNPFGRDLVQTASGLMYADVRMGRGDVPATGSIIIAHIKGFLADGTVFDDTRAVGSPLVMSAGVRPREVCEGLEEGLLTMRAGSIRLLAVPNELAFGRRTVFGSVGIIPGGSAVRYEVETLRCVDSDAGLVCCTCAAPPPPLSRRARPSVTTAPRSLKRPRSRSAAARCLGLAVRARGPYSTHCMSAVCLPPPVRSTSTTGRDPEFPCKTPTPIDADAMENSPLMRPPTTETMAAIDAMDERTRV